MDISSIEIAATKARLRGRALKKRKALFAQDAGRAAIVAAERGLAFLAERHAGVAAGYYPVNSELSPLPLMAALAKKGWKTALPVVVADNAPLQFAAWREGEELERGVHSIPCPVEGAPQLVPDIVVVPVLAFDRGGYRLGYGGGYYDRTLQSLRGKGKCIAIGLAFAGQMVDEVPHESFDQRLDLVLCEDGLIKG